MLLHARTSVLTTLFRVDPQLSQSHVPQARDICEGVASFCSFFFTFRCIKVMIHEYNECTMSNVNIKI